MPVYCYKCPECDYKEEVSRPMLLSNAPRFCIKCMDDFNEHYVQMRRNYQAEFGHGDVDGLMKENPRYSISGAVLDEDLPAAKKLHPHISDWKKVGNSWRPLIRNRKEKLLFMKQCGAHEYQ